MKKIFLLCMFLAGCATLMTPPETIRNEKCLDFNKMKVFQAVEDGALSYLCPDNYPSYYDDAFDACIVKGDFVFLSVKAKNNDLVDEQKITLPDGQCFVADGIYKYTTRQEITKTVRKIKMIDSQVKNPAFAEYQKQQAEQAKTNKK